LNRSLQRDAQVIDAASWDVNLGTVPGYRYPALHLHLSRTPDLAALWAEVTPGDRIDLTGIVDVRTQHPVGDVPLIVFGYTEEIDQFEWTVTANVGPFRPYRIGRMADDSGDDQGYPLRFSGDGSTLSGSVTQGASSVSVATPSGPLWTTDPDDFPQDFTVGGLRIEVTAISGTTSPQTFTVTPATVTTNLAAGLDVDMWEPNVIGL
jgi:hypothetical protein